MNSEEILEHIRTFSDEDLIELTKEFKKTYFTENSNDIIHNQKLD